MNTDDKTWMKLALREAQKAARKDEVPVGAVAIRDGKVLARAHNIREATHNPLGHAELLLLQKLSKKMKSWRLLDITLYVTLEPCVMCMGALLQSRIARLVFGAMDPKAGACGSLFDLSQDKRLNHRIEVQKGILAHEAAQLLSHFFQKRRAAKKQGKKLP